MNNLPGPDKGLFDVLFGSKPTETVQPQQATLPGEAGSVANGEDFAKIVAQAQDQTADVQKASVPDAPLKGGSPENLKSQTISQPVHSNAQVSENKSVKPTPLAKLEGVEIKQSSVKPAEDKNKKTENQITKKKANAETENLNVANVQAQAAAVVAPQVQVQPQSKSASSAVGERSPKLDVSQSAKPVAQSAVQPVIQKDVQGTVGPKQILAMPNEKLIESFTGSSGASRGALEPQAHSEAALPNTLAMNSANTVLQPIVIQVPVPMPIAVPHPMFVEVVEAVGSDNSFGGEAENVSSLKGFDKRASSTKSMVSSQDFLANRRGSILGVDRVDPRLMSRVSEESDGRSNDGSDLVLLNPHIAREFSNEMTHALADPKNTASVHSSQPIEISNPAAVASQVQGLMARGGGSVKVRIAPENLGEMTISVQSRGRQLDVKIEAGSKEAREALLGAVPQLREALASSRFEVGSIEVARSVSTNSEIMSFGVGGLNLNSTASSIGFMNQEHGLSDQNQNSNQNQQQGSNADRYFDQQDGRHQGGSRRDQAYKRYEEYAYGA